ncbi:MAG TPA: hemolysin family protein [Candidatus Saccharimonadales bacterium]|nr:hemolysin family protein [Candidatus Saccharimonadales bacterium]
MSFEVALLIAVAMLLGNAFFVGAEFGLISARRSSIELRALSGSRAAKITLDAMEHVSLMLAGAQLGVTLCSLILGAVGEPLLVHLLEKPFAALGMPEGLLHPSSFILALAIMVYFHVVIGEMVPKNIALAGPERAALVLTPPLALLVRATRPVVAALNAFANLSLHAFGVKPQTEIASTFTRDEVAGFVEESRREGLLDKDEGSLLSGALRFDERTVRSVLLPLEASVITTTKVTRAEIEKLVTETGYSRFPVQNTRGRLVGYLHLKDILEIDDTLRDAPIPTKDLRPLATLSVRTSLRSALAAMQKTGAHLAQVTGPRGKVLGIVALEDILEELVGEIQDSSNQQKAA